MNVTYEKVEEVENTDDEEVEDARVDEEEGAVNARVLDVTVALRSELLAQVRAVLVLDVLDNRVPAEK